AHRRASAVPAHTSGRVARPAVAARWRESLAPGPVTGRGAAAAAGGPAPGAPAHRASARGARRLAAAQRPHAVHPDVVDARGELLRLLVGGVILDRVRVEHHDVGIVARLELTAIRERQGRGGQCGELADRLWQRQHVIVAHVLGQYAGEVAIGAWMPARLEEYTLGRRGVSIGIEADPGQRHLAA